MSLSLNNFASIQYMGGIWIVTCVEVDPFTILAPHISSMNGPRAVTLDSNWTTDFEEPSNWQTEGTLPKTNIAPENGPSQKESSIPMYSNHPFSGAMLVSGSVVDPGLPLPSPCKWNVWVLAMGWALVQGKHRLDVLVFPLPCWCSRGYWRCCHSDHRQGICPSRAGSCSLDVIRYWKCWIFTSDILGRSQLQQIVAEATYIYIYYTYNIYNSHI